MGSEAWAEQAACAKPENVSLSYAFFPEDAPFVDERLWTARAKAVCGLCSVRSECLDYALRTETEFGIFGGLSASERSRLNSRAVTRIRLAVGAGR